MTKIKYPPTVPTDCRQCKHHIGDWKGHILCEGILTAALNCLDRKIECVRFKLKETNKK